LSAIIALTVVRPKPSASIVSFTDIVSCSIWRPCAAPAVASGQIRTLAVFKISGYFGEYLAEI
jgi:hypothetical protein